MNENEDTGIRINKLLSERGVCSRREADRMAEEGRITVNGKVCAPGTKVRESDDIRIDGKPIRKKDRPVLLKFYKPRGIVCSTKQQFDETTVTDFIDYPVRIYPVGRLDKDSEGLLLLTNRGDLVNHILKASEHHEKEYVVTVDREIDDAFIRGMQGGVPILDTVTRKCRAVKTGKRTFRIILTQGLNRQIRRMCEYFGYHVTKLKRIRIMDYRLDDMKPGEIREVEIERHE